MLEQAARVDDPIGHSLKLFGTLAGAALGTVAGVVVLLVIGGATEGVGDLDVPEDIDIVLSCLVLGAYLGGEIGATSGLQPSGHIKDGAASVFTGPERKKAARITDPITCHDPAAMTADIALMINGYPQAGAAVGWLIDKVAGGDHDWAHVWSGSEEVFIENLEAARRNDKTECGGTIQKGCDSVWIGGNSVGLTEEDPDEVPERVKNAIELLDWAGTFAGYMGGGREVLKGAAIALKYAGWALGRTEGENHWSTKLVKTVATGVDIAAGDKKEGAKELFRWAKNTGLVEKQLNEDMKPGPREPETRMTPKQIEERREELRKIIESRRP